jgi:hypothetical protein
MRRVLKIAFATAAIALGTIAAPAYATDTLVGDACSIAYPTISGQSAIACVGYYDNNLLQGSAGSATPQNILDDLNVLLTNSAPGVNDSSGGYSPPYSLDVDTVLASIEGLANSNDFGFGTTLSGLTVIGMHFGNNTDSDVNNVTAFWLFNLTTPGTTIHLNPNANGSSNAQLYTTGVPGVPEPATWGMMLLGFAGIGMAMRRRRRTSNALMQIA